jgi:hypothetical protein
MPRKKTPPEIHETVFQVTFYTPDRPVQLIEDIVGTGVLECEGELMTLIKKTSKRKVPSKEIQATLKKIGAESWFDE